MAYTQVTAPNTTVQDGAGWCLRHTQSVFASPVAFPSARKAWDGQKGRHTGIPPLGISVPIWFDHYGTYGSPAFWDNWGHAATRLADGRVLTSPFYSNYGSEIYDSIDHMARSMPGGATYLGWSEYMNGKQVVKAGADKPPEGEKEEEVPEYISSWVKDGNKRTFPADKKFYYMQMNKKKDVTVLFGPALVGGETSVAVTGTPGAKFTLRTVRDRTNKDASKVIERVFIEETDGVIPSDGRITLSLPVSNRVPAGWRLRVMARVDSGKQVNVERFAWKLLVWRNG